MWVSTRAIISCHRPALKQARRCINPATVVSFQSPGALKRKLMMRRCTPTAPPTGGCWSSVGVGHALACQNRRWRFILPRRVLTSCCRRSISCHALGGAQYGAVARRLLALRGAQAAANPMVA